MSSGVFGSDATLQQHPEGCTPSFKSTSATFALDPPGATPQVPAEETTDPTRASDPMSTADKLLGGTPTEASGHELKKTLTTLDLFGIGIGGIVGAGIYVLTGQAAADYAGPAVVISFIVAGVACCFAALCYSELAAMIPVSGSAYSFSSATMGELAGWIIGWDLLLEYLFGAAAVSVGWSGYAVSLLADMGAKLPTAISTAPFKYSLRDGSLTYTGGVFNLPAVLIIAAMTALNVFGIQESARFNAFVVVVKVSVLIIFVCAGAAFVVPANWSPFLPESEGLGVYGVSGVFRGASVLAFSLIGFDQISTAAAETINPQVSVPIATLGSLVIAIALYIAVALVLTGLVSYTELAVADPIAVAVNAGGAGLAWLRPIVKVGAILGLTSVIMVNIMGQARILYAMSTDGLLPPLFKRVSARTQTPWVSTIITGVLAAIIGGLLPIDLLGEMVSIGTLLAFVLVCAGVLVLRRRSPDLPRPFRVPYATFVCIAGVVSSLGLMANLPWETWLRLAVWMALGLLVYWFYSRHHSTTKGERASLVRSLRTGVPIPSAGGGGDPMSHSNANPVAAAAASDSQRQEGGGGAWFVAGGGSRQQRQQQAGALEAGTGLLMPTQAGGGTAGRGLGGEADLRSLGDTGSADPRV